jgi:flagellar hook-associated protein 2
MSSSLAVTTGLATGIDTASLISSLMSVERQPETILQAKQSTINAKVSEFTTILGKLSSLQTLAKGINTSDSFMSKTVDVSDSSVAKATTSSTAMQGSHQIKITSLAQNQIATSDGYSDETDTSYCSAGSFTITSSKDPGNPVTVNLTGPTSMDGLAAAINSSNSGVNASVINDGSGSPYRLVIAGNDAYSYTFDFSAIADSNNNLAKLDDPVSNPQNFTQSAQMASFTVDGISVTKASNTVSDVIPGVTFTLLQGPADGSAPGTTKNVTLNVNNDVDAVKKKINDFVTGYNAVMFELKGQSDYNTTTKKGGTLSGDSTVRTIQSQLQSILTTSVSGVTGQYSILSNVGIATQQDGSLKVDDATLTDALNNHFNDVVDLFTHNGDTDGLSNEQYGVAAQFNNILDTMTASYVGPTYDKNGLVATSINSLKTQSSDIDDQIAAMELRLTAVQTNYQKQFAAMETFVSNMQSQGNAMVAMMNSLSYA